MTRAILINPPRMINPRQRVKYGAAAALTRMAELAFDDLKAIAVLIANDIEAASYENRDARMRAITLAWSIVDQADLLRHLIGSEGEQIQLVEAGAFLSEAAPIRDVRNWMRHFPQRVDGYLARKEPLPPALGALSFCCVKTARVELEARLSIANEDVIEYQTFVLLSTAFERSHRLEGEPEKYIRFKLPVDHFFLQAYGVNISLDRIVQAMTEFCDALALGVSRFVTETVERLMVQGTYVTGMEDPAFEPGETYTMVAKRNSG